MEQRARHWVNAFEPATGLLKKSTYYEGGRWNHSFRLLQDMSARIRLAGGDDRFVELLDSFLGYGQAPVSQLGIPRSATGTARASRCTGSRA